MSRPYLSVCAIYRDEAEYLREWVEFHRLVGVERFFLYDNGSVDDHRRALEPYVEDGTVIVREWLVFPGQIAAYDDCLGRHRDDSRWIAFIDVDEYLFSPTGRPVPDVLREYEEFPAVGVNWAGFGTSGHRTKPAGLVTESYVRRARKPALNSLIKSVVDPARTERAADPHQFLYRGGQAVDEMKRPIDGPRTESVSFAKLKINHYVTKSEAEFARKLETPRADGVPRPTPWDLSSMHRGALNAEPDETITRYVPALREALERTESRYGTVRSR